MERRETVVLGKNDYFALRDGYAYFSQNLQGVPDSETLYAYRSKNPCQVIEQEMEICGYLFQVKKGDFNWQGV